MEITYAITPTRLGPLLVAASERGVYRLAFGRSVADLEGALAGARPDAAIRRDDATLAPRAEAVRRYLEGKKPVPGLPVDAAGTPFEERVWAALRTIPLGETRSYGAVARALGGAATAQEVAAACAANPVALVVPCHRVIRSDGTLGGYRWGSWRKRALLAIEARAVGSDTGLNGGATGRAA